MRHKTKRPGTSNSGAVLAFSARPVRFRRVPLIVDATRAEPNRTETSRHETIRNETKRTFSNGGNAVGQFSRSYEVQQLVERIQKMAIGDKVTLADLC